MKNLEERVAWAIDVIKEEKSLGKGVSDSDLAKKLGVNEKTLATYRKGQGSLKGGLLEKLVSIYNFNPSWILRGEGEPFPGARTKYPEVCGPEESAFKVNESRSEYDTGELVFVSQFRSPISAGMGLVPDDNIEMRVAFRRDWLRRKGDPHNMSLIKISGDSMEPTLLAGDLVLVNHSRDYLDPQGGIYAIAINNSIMVKRIQPDLHARKVKIISDNRKYSPMEVDLDQIKINGKVIWFAREIEK